mmetsp:Transcript_69404/g.226038  ORF Transcript_69404/g.226038 Transcript_69404/m.226038 type:complete len:83 (+) Transcript_69404:2-250(+)
MSTNLVEIDAITHHGLISACEKGREWAQALGLLGGMVANRAEANAIASNAAAGECQTGGAWARALELLVDMVACRVEEGIAT